jgi:hypothetical protein
MSERPWICNVDGEMFADKLLARMHQKSMYHKVHQMSASEWGRYGARLSRTTKRLVA